jgi:hypothetical protein
MTEVLSRTPEREPRAYEPIALELSRDDVATAMLLYQDFIELPKAERERIFFHDPDRPRTGTAGYEHKGIFAPDGRPLQDNKHIFHWTPDIAHEFTSPFTRRQNPNHLPDEARGFLDYAEEIYHSLSRSAKQKYAELEEEFPALVGIHFPKNGELHHHLRFLAYQAGNEGVLARGHYDKGTGTIAVAESHGGLRLGFGEHDLEQLERDQYDPVFFHGYGWHQLAQMLDVDTQRKAAWHDVVDTGESVSDDITRWALVYFIDPANIYLSSTKEQTHTPIRWRGERASQALHTINFLDT